MANNSEWGRKSSTSYLRLSHNCFHSTFSKCLFDVTWMSSSKLHVSRDWWQIIIISLILSTEHWTQCILQPWDWFIKPRNWEFALFPGQFNFRRRSFNCKSPKISLSTHIIFNYYIKLLNIIHFSCGGYRRQSRVRVSFNSWNRLRIKMWVLYVVISFFERTNYKAW